MYTVYSVINVTSLLLPIGAGAISKVGAQKLFLVTPHSWVVPPCRGHVTPRLILTILLFLSLDHVCSLINRFGERITAKHYERDIIMLQSIDQYSI